MALENILILAAASLLWATTFRNHGRTWFMLIASVVVIFWLQPALPIRGFDFWAPLATLVLVVLTWYLTADDEARSKRKNIIVLLIVASVVLLLNLTRFVPQLQLFTASRPPQLETTLLIFLITGLTLFAVSRLTRFSASFLTVGLVALIGLFLTLKVPALTYWVVYGLRSFTGQDVYASRITDFAWLGFSYVAFRLIHTIRDKQSGRFPCIDVGEFITYVIFFPAFTAGPIDRLERFIKDLRAPFAGLNLEDFYSAGQRLLLGLFKKFVIADALALIALNDTNATQVTSTFWMWVIVYAYACQIY